MTGTEPARRYRFGVFEADASSGELRRQGIRIKLNAQPFQVLLMLLEQPGKLLSREEITRQLWPEGTFVDSEHGVNSAINRIREALSDTASNPRFVETLARRGYRFVAPVERIAVENVLPPGMAERPSPSMTQPLASSNPVGQATVSTAPQARLRILSSAEELPKASYPVVQTFFVLLQFMYLGFYIGALANLPEIGDLLSVLHRARLVLTVLVVTAAILLPVRAFLITAALFRAPGLREKFLKIWPLLLPMDVLWALSPFLLLHHIHFGVAVACTPLLVYSPFAQRSLVLMGAGAVRPEMSAPTGQG
jgi:cholera toxin transcriptional activator